MNLKEKISRTFLRAFERKKICGLLEERPKKSYGEIQVKGKKKSFANCGKKNILHILGDCKGMQEERP